MSTQRRRHIVRSPEGFQPVIGRWIWALENARERTKKELAGLTAEVLDWTPPEGGNSIATMLYHMAVIEMSYLYDDVLEIGWSEDLAALIIYDARDDEGRLTVVKGESLDTHMKRLADCRDLLLKTYRKMPVGEFRRVRLIDDYEVTPEWVLHHLMQHEAEHRGQIAMIRARAEQAGK